MSREQSLRDAIEEFKCYSDRTESLYKRTSTCFQDIVANIQVDDDKIESHSLIPFSQLEDVEKELQKSPSVFFIGERNCGKSSIINELLRQTSLPINENPCTARIVRIKYAEQSYIRLVGSDGREVKKELLTGRKLPQNFIVVPDEERENRSALDDIVEVGLKHELLSSGIELIDSPGKSESDVLDRVLDEFLMKGTVPLFVYVIDGDMHLRYSDKESLSFLKGKFPQSPIMFVCNKVDITKEAGEFDESDDDDDDDDDGNDDDDGEQAERGRDKEEIVFNQLKEGNFLLGEFSQTCDLFHAISAKEVRDERLENIEGPATLRFQQFQTHLQSLLGKVMKSQTSRVVQTLLVLQESFVNVVQVQRSLITQQVSVIPDILKKADEIETKLIDSLRSIELNSERSKEKIVEQINNLKSEFVQEAEEYKIANERQLKREYQTMLRTALPGLSAELALLHADRTIVLERFISDMKGSILEKTCNALDTLVQSRMSDLVGELTTAIIDFNEYLSHPIVSRILKESWGMQFVVAKAETDRLLHHMLERILDSVKEAANIALRREISVPLCSRQISTYSKENVQNKANRRSIVESLLETINDKKVAEAVLEACRDRLQKMLETFQATTQFVASLQKAFGDCNMTSQLEVFRMHFTPQIRRLAVEGMALKYFQTLGPVELGSLIAETRHGVIYECTSERWCGASSSGQCVVKVLAKKDVSECTWNQTAVDLVNMTDMIQKLNGSHPNLLRLYGWVFAEPDVLHVVMERAERGLLLALQEGLTLFIRMNIALDVAKGLKAIHDIGYIHEDLKPGNILLMPDGTAKINLAKPESPYDMTPLGAPFHISPEMYQYHGKGHLSYSSYDIYAFGMLLWVLCEGTGRRRPGVYGDEETIKAMENVVEIGLLPQRLPGVSDECWELMSSCWNDRETLQMDHVIERLNVIRESCWNSMYTYR